MPNDNRDFLGGVLTGAVIVSVLDSDLRAMRVERHAWNRWSRTERAMKARSYARNILKTIRETPASLSNQRSQARKLVRQVRLAHSLDRGVVGFRAVENAVQLERKLRWEMGYSPVHVGPIDIS
jgi:hypothetical protein